MLKKYGFKAYFHGHKHALGFDLSEDGIGYFLSGAGGSNKKPCDEPDNSGPDWWGKGKVYGFLKMKLVEGELHGTYYFTSKKMNWKWDTYKTPVIELVNLDFWFLNSFVMME